MNCTKIFIISIKRLSHRIEIFKKNNPNVSFEVIYGCDKKDLKNKSRLDGYSKNSKLNHAEIAPLISHRKAWKHMVDRHIKKAFFLKMMSYCQKMQKTF